ncbi:MAG: hypothetical protein K2O78_03780 [Muribaculaceae bacterium]|nr:hypothetical protein [Muribaculaceae bacterium]
MIIERIPASSESGKIRRFAIAGCMAALSVISVACGSGSAEGGAFPEGFAAMDDAAKVEYMMKTVVPDSVARFICNAALGHLGNVGIDTLSMASLYAYEHYKDDELQSFQAAYDAYSENLPLNEKMKLRKLAAQDDPDRLGYNLGLEYVSDIREGRKTAAEVESEIAAMQQVCAANPEDSLTFRRFIKGFQIALDKDGAEGIPKEIFEKYKQ